MGHLTRRTSLFFHPRDYCAPDTYTRFEQTDSCFYHEVERLFQRAETQRTHFVGKITHFQKFKNAMLLPIITLQIATRHKYYQIFHIFSQRHIGSGRSGKFSDGFC